MMKSTRFIHLGALLAALAWAYFASGAVLSLLPGASRTINSYMLVDAVLLSTSLVFYIAWRVYRRRQRESGVMAGGFWVSLVLCSAVMSCMGLLYGAFDADRPALSPLQLMLQYILIGWLPVALLLLTLYIVSKIREKRRNQ